MLDLNLVSKSGISKASVILVGLSILAVFAGTTFAQPLSRITNNRPEIAPEHQPVEANMNQTTPHVFTSGDIENELATMRKKLASREAILDIKLHSFRNQKKATIAARISTTLNQINQNQVSQMQRFLDLMSTILDKLESRVNQPAPDIKNPAAAKVAIASARAIIASASAAVATQGQNDYTLQVTTESRIRLDAQSIRDKLHTDILVMRKLVADAKQAVAFAIEVANSGSGTNPGPLGKEGTTSGQP